MIDLYRKMRVCRCVCYEFFFWNLLQNRSQNCSCPWDRHVRRFYLRDDPKSHFKADWTILFHTNKSVGIFFWSISFLSFFLASFASKCKPLNKDQSDFYHKDLVRVYQKQNLALSWFKPASTLSSKCECWCEFEKDLELLPLRKFLRICVGRVFIIELPSSSTRASVFIFCELMFFQIYIDTWALLLKYLWFCQT